MRQTEFTYMTVKAIEEDKSLRNIEIYKDPVWKITTSLSRKGINFTVSYEYKTGEQGSSEVHFKIKNKENKRLNRYDFTCQNSKVNIPEALKTKMSRTVDNYLKICGETY